MAAQTPPVAQPSWYFACMHSSWDGERFRDALARVMQETGLSRLEVATLAGTHPSQVSRWMAGTNRPKYDALQSLAAGARKARPGLDGLVAEMIQAAGYDAGASASSQEPPQLTRPPRPPDEDGYVRPVYPDPDLEELAQFLERKHPLVPQRDIDGLMRYWQATVAYAARSNGRERKGA